MTYAYLQTGQDKAAQAIVASLPGIAKVFDPDAVVGAAPGSAGVFALAAIPARWALERRDWPAAARLVAAPSKVLYADAITYFAQALGAANSGAPAEARKAVEALKSLQTRLVEAKEVYWSEQVAIQHDTAAAFLALAEGKNDEALTMMRAAAAREDATEKNAVTPGPIAPARELLGEMLLKLNQPGPALAEFETTLKKEPGRFRALYGAAKSASLSGNNAKAKTYYGQLVAMCKKADTPGRAELAEARKALGR
jgi:tetratricopeptide (TPR) repeat protein